MVDSFEVELVYATSEQELRLFLSIASGTTLQETLQRFVEANPELGLMSSMPVGIWGRRVLHPETHLVQAGDRIELYRSLRVDPKEIRKRRAANPRSLSRSSLVPRSLESEA